ncbi:hypothetical protein CY34DRAFT_27728, partial [Suillus luteus UH-Slu-Lm8-n1]
GSAQCYNCHTTATPLWRKDERGKTVCNASVLLSPLSHNVLTSYIYTDAGLYYKLHGSAHPISMKYDIIRKR